MDIKREAVSGTLESSDIQIMLMPNQNGIEIDLKSSVMDQYGERIAEVIKETLGEMGVTSAKVVAVDKGALDCTVKARVSNAVYRSLEMKEFDWGK